MISEKQLQGLRIKWQPEPRQEEALRRTEFEILYGGARGGGKTDAGIAWLLYDTDKPLFRGLVIRKNYDDLSDWLDRAQVMYAGTGARFIGNPKEIYFPSGAVIRAGHLKDSGAYTKYQGHEYHRMLIEELTHIPTEENYLKLISSCRTSVPELRPQVFCTTNPGEIGHEWVKRRFIEGVDPGTVQTDSISGRTRIFIPAKVEDNSHLMEADPSYVKYLESLPPNLRKAWRDGSWEDYEVDGAYYIKALKELEQMGRIGRVPYEPGLAVDTWWDLGIDDATSIWFTQSFGKEIRVIEYLENTGEGLPYYARILQEKGYTYGIAHAPHDIEVRELGTGRSRRDTAKNLGINFKAMPRTDIADGIEAVRSILYRCWFDQEKCASGLKALKHYRKEWDEKRLTFKTQPVHDWSSHGADAFRLLGMGYKEVKTEAVDTRKKVISKPINSLTGW